MSSSSPSPSSSPQPPAPKRRRLNSPRSRRNKKRSKKCENCKGMTLELFMSQPISAFIDNDRESNQEIADKIVAFFNGRDDGSYAAVVADRQIKSWSFNNKRGYLRRVDDCRGRWIMVWRQCKSAAFEFEFDQSVVSAMVKGFILEYGKAAKVRDALQKVLGMRWSVIKAKDDYDIAFSHDGRHVFKAIEINGESWTVWRCPE